MILYGFSEHLKHAQKKSCDIVYGAVISFFCTLAINNKIMHFVL